MWVKIKYRMNWKEIKEMIVISEWVCNDNEAKIEREMMIWWQWLKGIINNKDDVKKLMIIKEVMNKKWWSWKIIKMMITMNWWWLINEYKRVRIMNEERLKIKMNKRLMTGTRIMDRED